MTSTTSPPTQTSSPSLLQIDAASALEGSALGRDIGRLGEPCTDEPLREARIEASGDGIFVSANAAERPNFEGRVVARVMRTDHPQVERTKRGPVRFERKHLPGGAQHHR